MRQNIQKLLTLSGLLAFLASPLLLLEPAVIQTSEPSLPITSKTPQAPAANHTAFMPNKPVNPSPAASTSPALPSPAPQTVNLSQGAIKQDDRILTKNGQTYPLRQYKPLIVPNDPFANQWWVAPNGMNAVWDIPFGARSTKVAVIDTGFGLAHQDLAGRWATNGGESGATAAQGSSKLNCTDQGLPLNQSCNNIDDNFDGIVDNEVGSTTRQNPSRRNCTDQGLAINKQCNRLDDDGNGYIDDWRGYDFASFDSNVQAGETNPAAAGSGTTHGTMTSGVLGATGNNGVGLAGINWYSSILPIQALNDDAIGDSFTVGESIYYAADQGADVISISLGSSAEDPYLRLAIQYAMSKGAIVVAAAGNDGCNCISYPANYPEVIAVGAIDSSGNAASFSSYGHQLDLLAPGASITTSTWSAANPTSAYASNVAGTSFSTPFVAGLLGLARNYQPNATWEEIIGAMLENSDRRTLTAAVPRNDGLGYGVARANSMLNRLRTPAQPGMRYQFGGAPYFGSVRPYQCETTLPASMLFELSRPGQISYTASQYENFKASQSGWISRELMPVCIGLPSDAPATLRLINLPAEVSNTLPKF